MVESLYIAVHRVCLLYTSTNFTAVAATFNNIGPGLSLVGPTCNFGFFNNFSKYILMLDVYKRQLLNLLLNHLKDSITHVVTVKHLHKMCIRDSNIIINNIAVWGGMMPECFPGVDRG